MAENDTISHRNVKAVVKAFHELDEVVIKTSREAQEVSGGRFQAPAFTVPIREDDLRILEDSHTIYQRSNYNMDDMLQYLEKTSELKQIWQSAMISILKACSHATATGKDIPTWKFRAAQLLKAGDRAWRPVIPCVKIITGGVDTVNEIVDKFAALDDALAQMCPALQMSTPQLRYSDELQDTIKALIAIYGASGNTPYLPPPTIEQIEVTKSEIRRRRKVQALAAAPTEQPTEDLPPPPPAPANPQLNGLPHNYNPTITAFVLLFTALSFLPGYQAMQYSHHQPGTLSDDSFWFLIQSSLMQILGLLTTILPLLLSSTPSRRRRRLQAWFWTWFFVAASAGCAGAAAPLYLYVPTEWSAMVAWLGAAAQAFVILQGMFVVVAAEAVVVGEEEKDE